MIKFDKKYTDALNRIIDRTDYIFATKSMRGLGDFYDPWYDFSSMERCIDKSESPYKNTLKLLQMGISGDYDAICSEIPQSDALALIEAGIWRREENRLATNNLIVLAYQGLKLLTEINPWYTTCSNRNTDVYIGSDSLRLAENIVFKRGATVLDLCSGTGIQGILAARSAKHVVSVELNPKTVPVTKFNIRLNDFDDIIEVRQGDLYDVLNETETFDYIYANPPFIPVTNDVDYPICGAGGEDGLLVLGRLFDGLPLRLNPNGEAIIFCECLGNEHDVFFDEHVCALGKTHKWRINQLRAARMEAELQIRKMSGLTTLFNHSFDDNAFCERMERIYMRLGAKYLYNIIYKIDACGYGDGSIQKIDQCNPWTRDDKAVVFDSITICPNDDSQSVIKNGIKVGALNNESVDVLNSLKEGRTLEETSKLLWDKYKHKRKYQKEGYPMFTAAMLTTCLLMEHIGAIRRIPFDENR